MKFTGKIKPNKFSIEHTKTCIIVYLFDNLKETKEKVKGKDIVTYDYDRYETSISYRVNFEKYIEKNFNILLERAKEEEKINLAKKIREKRNQLLAESDCYMAFDRLNLEVPDGNTFTAWKPFLNALGNALNSDWAKYRQALRDLPNQEGFPYNVEFPKKPY